MTLVEQAVDLPASPPGDAVEAGIDDCEDEPDPIDRDGTEVAALDRRDQGLRDASRPGEVDLAEVPAPAQASEHTAGPNVVHGEQDAERRSRGS